MTTFDGARALLAGRLRARARYWREKALEAGAFPEKCLTRAEECEGCADVAAGLMEAYAVPPEPDMAGAKRSAGK